MIDLNKYIKLIVCKYRYRKLSSADSRMVKSDYIRYIPDWINIDGSNNALYDSKGIKISNGYNRVVIGDYGPYIEINESQICSKNIKVKEGQEYRINNKRFSDNVKYWWMTANSNSDIKIYFQVREVEYADYIPKHYYILVTDVYNK